MIYNTYTDDLQSVDSEILKLDEEYRSKQKELLDKKKSVIDNIISSIETDLQKYVSKLVTVECTCYDEDPDEPLFKGILKEFDVCYDEFYDDINIHVRLDQLEERRKDSDTWTESKSADGWVYGLVQIKQSN